MWPALRYMNLKMRFVCCWLGLIFSVAPLTNVTWCTHIHPLWFIHLFTIVYRDFRCIVVFFSVVFVFILCFDVMLYLVSYYQHRRDIAQDFHTYSYSIYWDLVSVLARLIWVSCPCCQHFYAFTCSWACCCMCVEVGRLLSVALMIGSYVWLVRPPNVYPPINNIFLSFTKLVYLI